MKYVALSLALFLAILACHKTNQTSDLGKPYSLPSAAQANPAYDSSSCGIYKGVGIDSQDDPVTLQLIVNPDNAWCLKYQNGLLQDSLVRYVSAPPSQSPQQDHSAIDPGRFFQGIFESYDLKNWANASVQAGINGNGSNPLVFATLNRNSATSTAFKETSGKQVFCFLGNYIGTYIDSAHSTDSGRIGLVFTGNVANLVLVSKGPFPQSLTGTGTFIGGQLNIHVYDNRVGGADFLFTGYISGNVCYGNWQRPNTTAVGQFHINRTL